MRARLLVLPLLGLMALIAPAAADARARSSAREDGRVTIDVQIKRFAVVGRKIVARGVLTSRMTALRQRRRHRAAACST